LTVQLVKRNSQRPRGIIVTKGPTKALRNKNLVNGVNGEKQKWEGWETVGEVRDKGEGAYTGEKHLFQELVPSTKRPFTPPRKQARGTRFKEIRIDSSAPE